MGPDMEDQANLVEVRGLRFSYGKRAILKGTGELEGVD